MALYNEPGTVTIACIVCEQDDIDVFMLYDCQLYLTFNPWNLDQNATQLGRHNANPADHMVGPYLPKFSSPDLTREARNPNSNGRSNFVISWRQPLIQLARQK